MGVIIMLCYHNVSVVIYHVNMYVSILNRRLGQRSAMFQIVMHRQRAERRFIPLSPISIPKFIRGAGL